MFLLALALAQQILPFDLLEQTLCSYKEYTLHWAWCQLFDFPPEIRYTGLMGEYYIDDEVYEVDREVERAVIKRYLERRYISTLVGAAFIIGFLLGVLAYAL